MHVSACQAATSSPEATVLVSCDEQRATHASGAFPNMKVPRLTPRRVAYAAACALAGGALSVAGATVIFNGPIGGTVTNGPAPAIFYADNVTSGQGDGSGVVCGLSFASLASQPAAPSGYANEVVLDISNAFPGSQCAYTIPAIASSAGTVLQDIEINVSGWTASLNVGDCDMTLQTLSTQTTSTSSIVTFLITAPSAANWTANATATITGDLQAVPSAQFVASSCN